MNYSIVKIMTYRSVHQMNKEGFSIRKIAAELNLDWRAAKALFESKKTYLSRSRPQNLKEESHFRSMNSL